MRCPLCRADNAEDSTCRRCRADLSLLVTLEQARRAALANAFRSAAVGDGWLALEHAQLAHELRPDRDSHRCLALAYFLLRDFTHASAHHQVAHA